MRRHRGRATFALAVTAVMAGLTAAPSAHAQSGLHLIRVGTFDVPVFVSAPPGDRGRVLVVEQAGRIRLLRDGGPSRTFLDISSLVKFDGSRGLLSMAFAPDYRRSRLFYVYYTDKAGNNRVEEFRRSARSPDRANPDSRRTVIVIPHPPRPEHNGGQIQFGSDGLLYIAPGDGGGIGDPDENAQNLGSLLGKLLRIDPHQAGSKPYTVPDSNPFVAQPGYGREIYAYGLRNPFRFSFDSVTGDLTIGDVGQDVIEEIDFRRLGTGAGANFGWDIFEGSRPYEGGELINHIPPVLEHRHSEGFRAIIGGYVVRDRALGPLIGHYVYGDNSEPNLRAAVLSQRSATSKRRIGLRVRSLSSFGEDGCGRVYATSLEGPVYRLATSGRCLPDADPPGLEVRARRRQHLRRGRIRLKAHCDEACTVYVRGVVKLKGGGAATAARRRVRIEELTASLSPGETRRLDLGLGRKGRAKLRRALRRGRRANAKLVVTAEDRAGNRTTEKRRFRLRG
jgi:glucose/sorbosone dehydrogenase